MTKALRGRPKPGSLLASYGRFMALRLPVAHHKRPDNRTVIALLTFLIVIAVNCVCLVWMIRRDPPAMPPRSRPRDMFEPERRGRHGSSPFGEPDA